MSVLTTPCSDVWITAHALDRLREHYPDIGVRGARTMLAASRWLEPGEVSGFLQRSTTACLDHYWLSPDLGGIFVVATGRRSLPTDRDWSLVTYLRLTPAQQDQARHLWGGNDAGGQP